MKILIAVPTFESIFPDTYKSIFDMDKGGHEVLWEFVRGYDCATARNRMNGYNCFIYYVMLSIRITIQRYKKIQTPANVFARKFYNANNFYSVTC